MKTYEQKIPRIYQPLSLSCTISMQGTQAKQSFKTDETGDAAFNPNRRLTPTVILPLVRAYDPDGIFRSGLVNDLLADIHWYDGDTEIVPGADYAIDTTSSTTRGQLTVYRNTPAPSAQNLRFEALITDTRKNENIKVSVGCVISSVVSSGDEYEIRIDQPEACYINPIEALSSLTVNATAWRGSKGQVAIDYELWKTVAGTLRAVLATDYEVISASGSVFTFDVRMINEEVYTVIGKVGGTEVARRSFTIRRKYPAWTAKQSGTAELIPGQTLLVHNVDVSIATGVVPDALKYFSIQPHTVTVKNGDMNWGERQVLSINPLDAGFTDGSYVGVYFDVNEIPALNVATDENGNVLVDENNNRLLI